MTLNCASLGNGIGNNMRWADTRSMVLSVAHPKVIYAHARNFTAAF